MGYCYEPLAIVDEETYDAAMWNEVESRKHLNDNMLMPDFDEVDEQAWDEAVDAVLEDASYIEDYEAMVKAMEGPTVEYEEGTPYEVAEKIETINAVLNGYSISDLKVYIKVRNRLNGIELDIDEVCYVKNVLWATHWVEHEDAWEAMRLDVMDVDSLDRILDRVIEINF